MAAWQMTIHGGFAWVFASGGSSATIGPFRKPSDVHDYHPHEMVLRVPNGALIEDRTSLPFRRDKKDYLFVLRGEVALQPDGGAEGASGLERVKTNSPKDWNDFYYVYDADGLKDSGEAPAEMADGWEKLLLAALPIRDGVLRVLQPRFAAPFEINRKLPKPKHVDRSLATHIEYTPRSSPAEVVFHTDHGDVVARPAHFDIAADCGCPDFPPAGGEIPGFGVTFKMYKGSPQHLQFVPRVKGTPNQAPAVDPGPDCPPRAFSI
jgi:hypothetical protein